MNPVVGISFVLAALGLLLASVKLLKARGLVGPEMARKLVHLGMGVVCFPFPWIFSRLWPVWTLAGLAVAGLVALRGVPRLRKNIGGVLHDVNRVSWGEVYFPIGAAIVFTLARGERLLFVVPIALLTFADAAGALVGKRWGRHPFNTIEGTKSVEGSLAVGTVAFFCAALPLWTSGYGFGFGFTVGGVIGLFGLLVEAISWRGLDNIFLPLAAFAQMSIYLHTSFDALVLRFCVLLTVTVAALSWRRGHIVDDSARLGGAVALYFFWAMGGWRWLVAPLVLMASYVRLMPTVPGGVKRHDLIAVICIGSVGLVWGVVQAIAPDPIWVWFFTLGLATHQAIIALVRFSQARPHWPRTVWWGLGTAQGAGLQVLVFSIIDRGESISPTQLAEGVAALAVATGLFALCEKNLQMPDDLNARWWKQGLTGITASLSGFCATGFGIPAFATLHLHTITPPHLPV